jgi:hypothetical protein
MTTKFPPAAPERVEQQPEKPEGFVADVPTTFDDDETEWAERVSKEADADNPALAQARARLAALARARVDANKPR